MEGFHIPGELTMGVPELISVRMYVVNTLPVQTHLLSACRAQTIASVEDRSSGICALAAGLLFARGFFNT